MHSEAFQMDMCRDNERDDCMQIPQRVSVKNHRYDLQMMNDDDEMVSEVRTGE